MTNTSAKKASPKGWHSADIKAALEKAGWSVNQLGLAHGYTASSALGQAFQRPYPKAERIIADTIGVHPMVIWPNRYDAQGNPNRPRGRKPQRPATSRLPVTKKSATVKDSARGAPCNAQSAAGA